MDIIIIINSGKMNSVASPREWPGKPRSPLSERSISTSLDSTESAAIRLFANGLEEWARFQSRILRLFAAAGRRSLFYNAFVDPLRELGRTLLYLGGFLVIIGALLFLGGKLPFRLGRLPGDIIHRGEHTTFYFPIVTCVLLSLVLSLLLWLFSHFRR